MRLVIIINDNDYQLQYCRCLTSCQIYYVFRAKIPIPRFYYTENS